MIHLILAAALAAGPALAAENVAREPRTVAPCATDEGPDGQGVVPCVWDARHRGNGIGRSFLIRRDHVQVYITHRRAHRLAN